MASHLVDWWRPLLDKSWSHFVIKVSRFEAVSWPRADIFDRVSTVFIREIDTDAGGDRFDGRALNYKSNGPGFKVRLGLNFLFSFLSSKIMALLWGEWAAFSNGCGTSGREANGGSWRLEFESRDFSLSLMSDSPFYQSVTGSPLS